MHSFERKSKCDYEYSYRTKWNAYVLWFVNACTSHVGGLEFLELTKHHLQDVFSVSTPPSKGPTAVASATTTPVMPWYLPRSCRDTTSETTMLTTVLIPPPPIPATAPAITTSIDYNWQNEQNSRDNISMIMLWDTDDKMLPTRKRPSDPFSMTLEKLAIRTMLFL